VPAGAWSLNWVVISFLAMFESVSDYSTIRTSM
jgi:hypothetical protein